MSRPTPPNPIDPFLLLVIVAFVLAIGFLVVSIAKTAPECTPNHTNDGCRVTGSP